MFFFFLDTNNGFQLLQLSVENKKEESTQTDIFETYVNKSHHHLINADKTKSTCVGVSRNMFETTSTCQTPSKSQTLSNIGIASLKEVPLATKKVQKHSAGNNELMRKAFEDLKSCLTEDEDGNL